jgi:hypothetical protein
MHSKLLTSSPLKNDDLLTFNTSIQGRIVYFLLIFCGFLGSIVFFIFTKVNFGIYGKLLFGGISGFNVLLFFYSLLQIFRLSPRIIVSNSSLVIISYLDKQEIKWEKITSITEIGHMMKWLSMVCR